MGVVVALSKSWDALDHDFRHHYGLDLAEACWGAGHIGIRRLLALISRLPATSEWAKDNGGSWDDQREMNARLVELTWSTWHATASLASAMTSGKYTGARRPLKIPRPSDKTQTTTRQDLRAALRRGGG